MWNITISNNLLNWRIEQYCKASEFTHYNLYTNIEHHVQMLNRFKFSREFVTAYTSYHSQIVVVQAFSQVRGNFYRGIDGKCNSVLNRKEKFYLYCISSSSISYNVMHFGWPIKSNSLDLLFQVFLCKVNYNNIMI